MPAGDPGAAVDDKQFVRQIEHQIALVFGALQTETDRIEGEGQVVAERAIQAEVIVPIDVEGSENRPQSGENAGLLAAFLFEEGAASRQRARFDGAVRRRADGKAIRRFQGFAQSRQDDDAAFVQRFDADTVSLHGDSDRGVDEAGIPARVSAGIFEAAGENAASGPVQTVDERLDRGLAVDFGR